MYIWAQFSANAKETTLKKAATKCLIKFLLYDKQKIQNMGLKPLRTPLAIPLETLYIHAHEKNHEPSTST